MSLPQSDAVISIIKSISCAFLLTSLFKRDLTAFNYRVTLCITRIRTHTARADTQKHIGEFDQYISNKR